MCGVSVYLPASARVSFGCMCCCRVVPCKTCRGGSERLEGESERRPHSGGLAATEGRRRASGLSAGRDAVPSS